MQLHVGALVGQPGETQDLLTTIAAEELDFGDQIRVGSIDVKLLLEGVVEGILATGLLEFELTRPCARCLTDIVEHHRVDVAEVFFHPDRSHAPVDRDDEAYELVDDASRLDLVPLVHDSVLIDQPVRTLCRPDCAGLCVVCGVDRNLESCDCDTRAPEDPRWAALADVELDQPRKP